MSDHGHDHDHEHGSELARSSSACGPSRPCSPRRATSIRGRSTSSSRPTRPGSGLTTAPASSPRPGPIRRQEGAARGRQQGDRHARSRHGSRPPDRGREHARATTWSSARCAPATRGKSSACRRWYRSAPYRSRAVTDPRGVLADSASRCRADTRSACGTRPPRPLHRATGAPGRHRRLERGAARGARHPRRHDRHGLARQPKEIASSTAFTTWAACTGSERSSPSPTSQRSTRLEGARARAAASPWSTPARGTSTCRGLRRSASAARLSRRSTTSDGRWHGVQPARPRTGRRRRVRRRPRAAAGRRGAWVDDADITRSCAAEQPRGALRPRGQGR